MIEKHQIRNKYFTLNNSFEDNHCNVMMKNLEEKINKKMNSIVITNDEIMLIGLLLQNKLGKKIQCFYQC